MEKKNKLIFGLIIALTLAIVGVCIYSLCRKDEIEISDSVKFKEEYESLNGALNNNNELYPSVEISVDNPIVYKTDEEIIDILKNESAIIYFGFKNCPWCRNMIEPLLKAAKEKDLKTLYYVNIYDIRDSYTLNNNKVEKTKEGTEAYKKILKFLGNNLSEYYLKDEEDKEYDTKTTRLFAPTVVAVKGGKVMDIHEGTLSTQTDPYQKLSSEELIELKEIYSNLIDSIEEIEVCETSESC